MFSQVVWIGVKMNSIYALDNQSASTITMAPDVIVLVLNWKIGTVAVLITQSLHCEAIRRLASRSMIILINITLMKT